jgi:hypothetical protein
VKSPFPPIITVGASVVCAVGLGMALVFEFRRNRR